VEKVCLLTDTASFYIAEWGPDIAWLNCSNGGSMGFIGYPAADPTSLSAIGYCLQHGAVQVGGEGVESFKPREII
jgi:hypothetical protein